MEKYAEIRYTSDYWTKMPYCVIPCEYLISYTHLIMKKPSLSNFIKSQRDSDIISQQYGNTYNTTSVDVRLIKTRSFENL